MSCGHPLAGSLAPHACADCESPQPVTTGEDYFTAFGLDRRFHVDRASAERRFYELSRVLHPDRFSAASAEVRRYSLERMSFLNDAWRTLRSRGELRSYLLKLEGIVAKSRVPADLAEAWFDLQDHLTPEKARAFRAELEKRMTSLEAEIRDLEVAYDSKRSSDTLSVIAAKIDEGNYLRSLERDLDKAVA